MQINTNYHRVTEILSRFTDYDKIPEYRLNIAAERGNRVHELCERYAVGEDLHGITADIYPYVQAFAEWFDNVVDDVRLVEKRLYSKTSNFTGQIDLIARLAWDKSYSVIDIKTTSQPHKTWHLQTAAYRMLCEENEIEVDRRLILHLKNTGSYDIIEYTKHQRDQDLFLNALSLFNFFNCSIIKP